MTEHLEPILAWYSAHARDLPWRDPGASPWAVLVSEIMLQQTPVSRVLPAYRQWLDRWPTPAALAAEPAGEAVRQWGRLGYPRRALRLHETARILTQQHSGNVPNHGRTAHPARNRHLYRCRGSQLRLRPAPCRAGYQRAPRHRQARQRRAVPAHHPSVAEARLAESCSRPNRASPPAGRSASWSSERSYAPPQPRGAPAAQWRGTAPGWPQDSPQRPPGARGSATTAPTGNAGDAC